MQNNCNCGCQGFVPVSGNWDFNNGCGCQQGYGCRNRRSNGGCQQCGEYESTYTRERDNDCQCERCNDSREVACCDQNTYIRDMGDECGKENTRGRSNDCGCDKDDSTYNRSRSGNCGCDKDDSTYNRSRSTCSCDDDCQCDNCVRNRNRNRSNDCDECSGGSAYTRSRSGNCGCDKDDNNYTRSRSNDCGCDKDNGSTYARSNKNRTVGMINVEMQEIDEIFESESALRAGTLFPELHKPMNGYCPCDSNCGTCKQQAAFAAWEMRLYLNTHPNDKEALKLFRKLCKEAEDENYATTFLEDECCTTCWNWVKNPWPWEYDCQCRSGCDCGD